MGNTINVLVSDQGWDKEILSQPYYLILLLKNKNDNSLKQSWDIISKNHHKRMA